MKRTLTSTAPLLALLMGAAHAAAQSYPNGIAPAVAKDQYRQAEQRAAEFLQKALKAGEDGREIPRQELREKVRPLVQEAFEARQQLQKAELDALRRRLADIEQAIENREKNKESVINARVEDMLNRNTSGQGVQIQPDPDPNRAQKGRDAADFDRQPLPRQNDSAEFDLGTRHRLAELDVQAAEDDYRAAGDDFSQARSLHQSAAISATELRSREKEYRHAAMEVKRAKIRLDGLRRQQTELEAKADAAINAAMADEQKAFARLHNCEANVKTAQARVLAAEADAAKAKATYEYRENQHERVMMLFEKNAVEEKVLDEAAEQLHTGKADLDGAKAALDIAVANLDQAKEAIMEAQAEVKAAEEHVRAVTVERDRLKRQGQGHPAPASQESVPTGASSE